MVPVPHSSALCSNLSEIGTEIGVKKELKKELSSDSQFLISGAGRKVSISQFLILGNQHSSTLGLSCAYLAKWPSCSFFHCGKEIRKIAYNYAYALFLPSFLQIWRLESVGFQSRTRQSQMHFTRHLGSLFRGMKLRPGPAKARGI